MDMHRLNEKCFVNTNKDADTFVGIKCENGDFSVHFPLGFDYSTDENQLRKEIFLLINTIAGTIGHKTSEFKLQDVEYNHVEYPIQACMFIICDYYEHGLYLEYGKKYMLAKSGKINWNRTIKTQKPYVQGSKAFYLDYVVSKKRINEDELITHIHEWCVYDSFLILGWLFTPNMPGKPEIKFDKLLFERVILNRLLECFNDNYKRLFNSMLALIRMHGSDTDMDYKYGTDRFEYVWERLIDRAFGISDKERFFPKTRWILKGNQKYSNACLEPDSIMIYKDKIYILDAKYYKYGSTFNPMDLPESTSINKQITYGEYVKRVSDKAVFNAFIMPFSKISSNKTSDMESIGEAISDWKSNENSYERIQGILLDVKYLMNMTFYKDKKEIMRLAELIEAGVSM